MAASKKISFFKNCKRNSSYHYYLLCVYLFIYWLLCFFFVPQTQNTLIKWQRLKFCISLECTLSHFSTMISNRIFQPVAHFILYSGTVWFGWFICPFFYFDFSHDGECIPSSRYWASRTKENPIADGHKNGGQNIHWWYNSLIAR